MKNKKHPFNKFNFIYLCFIEITTRQFICQSNSLELHRYIFGRYTTGINRIRLSTYLPLNILFGFSSETKLSTIQDIMKAIYNNQIRFVTEIHAYAKKPGRTNYDLQKFKNYENRTQNHHHKTGKNRKQINNSRLFRKLIRKHQKSSNYKKFTVKHNVHLRLTTKSPAHIINSSNISRIDKIFKRLLCGEVSTLNKETKLMVTYCRTRSSERDYFFALFNNDTLEKPIMPFYYNTNLFRTSYFEKSFYSSDETNFPEFPSCVYFESLYVNGVLIDLREVLKNLKI